MSNLTPAQQNMMNVIKDYANVYVSDSEKGYTFSHYKDNTCARVYVTQTAKSLIKRGFCEIKFCDVGGALGILEIV